MVHFECSSWMKKDEDLNLRSLDLAKSRNLIGFFSEWNSDFFSLFQM